MMPSKKAVRMGDEGKAVRRGGADGFAVQRCSQFKISQTKLSISKTAVIPPTASTKASLASWLPANRSIFMAEVRLRGCTVREERMGLEFMGQAFFNTKPHSRSA
jgi:hypothetical protein